MKPSIDSGWESEKLMHDTPTRHHAANVCDARPKFTSVCGVSVLRLTPQPCFNGPTFQKYSVLLCYPRQLRGPPLTPALLPPLPLLAMHCRCGRKRICRGLWVWLRAWARVRVCVWLRFFLFSFFFFCFFFQKKRNVEV